MKYIIPLILSVLSLNMAAQTYWISVHDTVQVRNVCECSRESKIMIFHDWFKVKVKNTPIKIEIAQENPDNRVVLFLKPTEKKEEFIAISKDGEVYDFSR